ncbi:ABC transporter permease [Anaerobacillus alkalidiazotrophicus]|uniref:ABC transporter permease n=1 Tax=Anaerobacillus alkalidiazotrophicus TaxID=472963 RepID=A0A1S2MB33_9BACI|nr:ABC transporter permease [Anaerobacillus alkalidiazotrophicus]OIJ21941.1 ABC transporter permease [Anaerobacillus alkalidiazotrophicus]
MTTTLKRLVFFTVLIAIWESIYRLNLNFEFRTTRFFPSPSGAIEQLYKGFFESGILSSALITSLQRIGIGFTLAIVIGAALGILLGQSKLADETIGSLVIALQSIPSIVWLPIALILFGSQGNTAIIFIIVLGGTWAMTMNMRMGIKNVQPLLVRAARTMGYKGYELVWKVMIPASIPAALTGARLAWAFGWRALMAGELLGRGGLGRTLLDARDMFNMDLVIAIMVIISVIGLIVEYLIFAPMEKKVMTRWGLTK